MSTTTTDTGAPTADVETAPCQKCTREISVEADRCPECSYEPGPGILGGIVMWVSGMTASVFVTIALVTLLVIATGFPIIDGLIVFAVTGGIGAVLLGIVYAGIKNKGRGPTDPPVGTEMNETVESWDGEAAGEAAAERINNLGPAIVAALPAWTWTAGVSLGVMLHLSLWVATAQDSEIGMGVGLLGGMIVSLAAVAADTHRVKWSKKYSPRWWFWTFPAVVPLFGWIFGLTWLLRKRQKTGTVIR